MTLLVLLLVFTFVGCKEKKNEEEDRVVSIIMPTGTPALGLASYAQSAQEEGKAEVKIVGGADLLKAAFIDKSYDIIVAPVNLGAMMYNQYQAYVLYKAFVWGNLYLATKSEISSFSDINGKKVVVFGQNSTPDIIFKGILQFYQDVNVEIEYVDDVSTANSMLSNGSAEYIISAEPSLSKIKDKLGLNVLDLQEEWKKVSGSESYPQAGIFVKKELLENKSVSAALLNMINSVKGAVTNKDKLASDAIKLHTSFETLGSEVLIKAIPNCHFQVLEDDSAAVLSYLQKMIDLGFGKQVGGALPDEGFFA